MHSAQYLVAVELGRAVHAHARVRVDWCQDPLVDRLDALLLGLKRFRCARPRAPRGQSTAHDRRRDHVRDRLFVLDEQLTQQFGSEIGSIQYQPKLFALICRRTFVRSVAPG